MRWWVLGIGGHRRVQQLLRRRCDRPDRRSSASAARLRPVAARDAERRDQHSQCGAGPHQWRADRPLGSGAGRALGGGHRGDRRGAHRSRHAVRTHGRRPLHFRRQRGRDFHRADRGTRAMVLAQRHCARHGAVLEPRARRLLRRGYLDGVGPPALRGWLAAASVARCRLHRGGPGRGAAFLLARPPLPAARAGGRGRRDTWISGTC